MDAVRTQATSGSLVRLPRSGVLLLGLFLLTLPFVNPWIRGDGVGYYAYLRAAVVQHNLRFERDWQEANPSARAALLGTEEEAYTSTGHLDNHFSVGPAVLWSPFFVATHVVVLGLNRLGARIPSDGFSRPYRLTIALATAIYAFLGLLLSFSVASRFFQRGFAFLATVGIWFGSSLPVYMYFNPSWSHAHSAFVVALFVWYWLRTREHRTFVQWALLGLISGLVVDVYYPNGVVLLLPLLESLRRYGRLLRENGDGRRDAGRLLLANLVYLVTLAISFSPTLITRKIIFGGYWKFGAYTAMIWQWKSPVLMQVLFSSDHGLLIWTPILIPALMGLAFLCRIDAELGVYFVLVVLCFYYVIASYPVWDGISSFGNRFFVSLTPFFIVGLAATLDFCSRWFHSPKRYLAVASGVLGVLVLWNFGFIFQWGTQLISPRGPVSWKTMVHNQYAVVPEQITDGLENYFLHRRGMMQHIESRDVQRLGLQQ